MAVCPGTGPGPAVGSTRGPTSARNVNVDLRQSSAGTGLLFHGLCRERRVMVMAFDLHPFPARGKISERGFLGERRAK